MVQSLPCFAQGQGKMFRVVVVCVGGFYTWSRVFFFFLCSLAVVLFCGNNGPCFVIFALVWLVLSRAMMVVTSPTRSSYVTLLLFCESIFWCMMYFCRAPLIHHDDRIRLPDVQDTLPFCMRGLLINLKKRRWCDESRWRSTSLMTRREINQRRVPDY